MADLNSELSQLLLSSKCFLRYIKNILWFHKINTKYGWCEKTYRYKSSGSWWEGRDHLKVHHRAEWYVLSSHHPLSHGSSALYNSYQALPSSISFCNNFHWITLTPFWTKLSGLRSIMKHILFWKIFKIGRKLISLFIKLHRNRFLHKGKNKKM